MSALLAICPLSDAGSRALEMQLSEGSSELLEALEASVNRLKNDETFQVWN